MRTFIAVVVWMAWMAAGCADAGGPPLHDPGDADPGGGGPWAGSDAATYDGAGQDDATGDAVQDAGTPNVANDAAPAVDADADTVDTGVADAGAADAGPADAGAADAGAADAGPADTGVADGGSGGEPDAGPPEPTCSDTQDCACATFGEAVYRFCTLQRRWADARAHCQAEGFDLVQIDSTEENAFLHQELTARGFPQLTHIGANDLEEEGTWRWPDGSIFWMGQSDGHAVDGRYTNWAWGEPDDFFGQDCGVIMTSSGEWGDENCGDPRPFICQHQLE